ncbi:MAG: FKBP-type peptidyl-prolyl cis-trans isomerase [Patescibacteria group bacterium]
MQNKKGNTSVIVSFIIVVCVVGLVVYALLHKKERENPLQELENSSVAGQQDIPQASAEIKKEPAAPKKSMEQQAKNGDTLIMNYTGRLTNGTVFDSNVDPKFQHVEPFEFTLGAGQVIKGWDEGLLGMKVGEKRILTVPPEKGYGDRAVGGIPANSTLIFDVELVAIK